MGPRPNSWRDRALSLVPLLFAVPVLTGIAISLANLLGNPHPSDDFLAAINNGAEALHRGEPLYQDPAEGYTGMMYTPLVPAVVALLFNVALWSGWPILLAILSALALMALAARLAFRAPGPKRLDQALGVLEALGIGALTFLLVSTIESNGLYDGRIDQPAWALGILGLALVPAAAKEGSRWAWWASVGAIVLLSAAFWARQNAVVPAIAAVAWLALAAWAGAVSWRPALRLLAGLATLNLFILGVLNALTGGWELYFNLVVPSEHSLGDPRAGFEDEAPAILGELVMFTGLAILFAGVIGLALARHSIAALGREALDRLRRAGGRGRAAAALGVMGLLAYVGAAVAQSVASGDAPPTLWLLALLGFLLVLGATVIGWIGLAVASSLGRGSEAGAHKAGEADAGGRSWSSPLRRALRSPIALLLSVAGMAGVAAWLEGTLVVLNFPTLGAGWPLLRIAAVSGAAVTAAFWLAVVWGAVSFLAARGLGRPGHEALSKLEARHAAGSWLRDTSTRARLATVLGVFIALDVLANLYVRQKLGGGEHYYFGIAWALALLGALAYRRARAELPTALVATCMLLAIFGLAALPRGATDEEERTDTLGLSEIADEDERIDTLGLPSLSLGRNEGNLEGPAWVPLALPTVGLVPVHSWSEPEPAVLRYAREHPIYDPGTTDPLLDTPGALYPFYDNWYNLKAAGGQPDYLIDALLDRRFDALQTFSEGKANEALFSGSGRFEERFVWKLNRVIEARYRPVRSGPLEGVEDYLERRPGPEPAPWMRRCFNPFELAGVAFRINRGGGFWCTPAKDENAIALVETPARYSDVRSDRPIVAAQGQLVATLPERSEGFFELVIEPPEGEPFRVRGERPSTSGDLLLSVHRGGMLLGRAAVPSSAGRRSRGSAGAHARIALDGSLAQGLVIELGGASARGAASARARLRLPPLEDGVVLRLAGSRRSQVRYELGGLRLTPAG